jgi:hypothetical protein
MLKFTPSKDWDSSDHVEKDPAGIHPPWLYATVGVLGAPKSSQKEPRPS